MSEKQQLPAWTTPDTVICYHPAHPYGGSSAYLRGKPQHCPRWKPAPALDLDATQSEHTPAGFRGRGCQRFKMEKASAGGCGWASNAQALFSTGHRRDTRRTSAIHRLLRVPWGGLCPSSRMTEGPSGPGHGCPAYWAFSVPFLRVSRARLRGLTRRFPRERRGAVALLGPEPPSRAARSLGRAALRPPGLLS